MGETIRTSSYRLFESWSRSTAARHRNEEKHSHNAGALTLFFAGDLRVKEHFNEIERGQADGHICSVNLAEFYYKTCEKLGKQTADTWYHQSRAILRVVETDETLTHSAGLEKCRQARRLSLADCHALALTRRLKALLLTTDSELANIKDIEAKYIEV